MVSKKAVRSWAAFDRRFRYGNGKLLARLPAFGDAVLVAGCQRSGTTAVTRILREAMGVRFPQPTKDDELDAALILADSEPFETDSRCCFQTTYINDHYAEYFQHDDYRLIWIVRRPDAVIRSMLKNWSRGALNRLFRACGHRQLDAQSREKFRRWGGLAFSQFTKACLSYAEKTSQIHEIAAHLGNDRLLVIDYDELLEHQAELLPRLFAFAGIEFDQAYLSRLGNRRSGPAEHAFTDAERAEIARTCSADYEQAKRLRREFGGMPTGGNT